MCSLSDAWFNYADMLRSGSKDEWFRLRQLQSGSDNKSSSNAQAQRRALELELQWELIDCLVRGEFQATGRDITDNIDPPLTPISAALFFPKSADFEVDWESNSLKSFGKHIIDISVATSDSRIEQPKQTPKRKGRPPVVGNAILRACQIAASENQGFCRMPAKNALMIVNRLISEMEHRPARLDDGAKLKTFRPILKSFCSAETQRSQN